MVGGPDSEHTRMTAFVRGHVQGVGFRWWTRSQALELGLTGWARNTDDGRVEVVAEGPADTCTELLARLKATGMPGRVDSVVEQWSDPKGVTGFVER
jgi:acylphosphatase